ncbi:alpha/beta hydrolase-fold protein [Mycobacterium sp. NPDC003449]
MSLRNPACRGNGADTGCPRVAVLALRLCLVSILLACLFSTGQARATDVEYLLVPSRAMGRDIPVTFQQGGPHAVFLLDAFNAAPDVSNWVTAGNALKTLGSRGVSVVAPAGGAWSMYTDWELDDTRKWDTFLTTELPDWLAANRGLAPGGHAIVGAAQGGTAALSLAEFHPDLFRYAGSMSGFLTPSATALNGAITAGMARFGGVNTQDMWGAAQLGRWKPHDPNVHIRLLIENATRIWVFSPSTLTCTDPAAMIGYCDQAQGSNKSFYANYRTALGDNGHFDFPTFGEHDWSSWGPQLAAMADDVTSTIR